MNTITPAKVKTARILTASMDPATVTKSCSFAKRGACNRNAIPIVIPQNIKALFSLSGSSVISFKMLRLGLATTETRSGTYSTRPFRANTIRSFIKNAATCRLETARRPLVQRASRRSFVKVNDWV